MHENGDEEYKYFINGDTMISSRTYYKLYKTGILYLDSPFEIKNKYIGAIRDSANRFFYIDSKSGSEKMLYNFDAKPGESICPDCDGMDYIVGETDTLDNGRKRFYIDIMTVHCGSANRLIEGIGWLGGLLEGNACFSHPGIRGSYLLCYSENGIPVYETEEYARCGKKLNCNNDITSSNQAKLLRTPEITLLNNHMLEICFSDGLNDLYNIEIYNIKGEKVFQQTTDLPGVIDLKIGSGTFIIRISKEQIGYTSKFVIQ